MATPVYYTGDTWPPLTGTIRDAAGVAVSLATADSFRVVSKESGGATVIEGTGSFCPVEFGGTGDGTDGKWQYVWAAGDLTVADDYVPELEVTWDGASTPPKIETFRTDTEKFIVLADND